MAVKWIVKEFKDEFDVAEFLGTISTHQQALAKVSASDTTQRLGDWNDTFETKHYWHVYYPAKGE